VITPIWDKMGDTSESTRNTVGRQLVPQPLRGLYNAPRKGSTGSNPVLTTKKHLKPFGVITRRKSIFAS